MITPKECGKIAHRNGINAPTLDGNLASLLGTAGGNISDKKTSHYVQWWEGWYESLDESLALQHVKFTNPRLHQHCQ
ncbi:hypothetical protein CBR65_18535 [Cellvibrio sp. PSBB006]|jgi:hypothetical protein|nr:hypothetical protein CBR65_18535 [Cellvibrio sp. PSBB006]